MCEFYLSMGFGGNPELTSDVYNPRLYNPQFYAFDLSKMRSLRLDLWPSFLDRTMQWKTWQFSHDSFVKILNYQSEQVVHEQKWIQQTPDKRVIVIIICTIFTNYCWWKSLVGLCSIRLQTCPWIYRLTKQTINNTIIL